MGASAKWIKSLIGFQKSNSTSSDQVSLFDFSSILMFHFVLANSLGFFMSRRRLGVTKPGHGSYGGVHQPDVLLFHHQRG